MHEPSRGDAGESAPPSGVGLRNAPRQARAEVRIARILDAAERVVERLGYEGLTTNHVAEQAGVSIGSVYRWFPDKRALLARLSERYVERVETAFESLVVDDPELPAAPLVDRLARALAALLAAHPSVREILRVASAEGEPGARLRETLVRLAERIVDTRVTDIPPEERRLTAEALATVALAFLAHPVRSPRDPAWISELIYLLSAYTSTKYPPRGDPAWKDPGHRPAPVRPGLDRMPGSAAGRQP